MESGIQSSFIPHDTSNFSGNGVGYERGGLNDLMLLISIVLVLASGALAGGVFLYKEYVAKELQYNKDQLKLLQDQFDQRLIRDITRLDDKMRAAETILSSHIAPSVFFKVLNASTLQTIGYRSLELSANDPQRISLRMAGVAASVNSIAFQAEKYAQSPVITSPIFSSIDREQDGVHFNLSAVINPAALSYSTMMTDPAAAAPFQDPFAGPSVSNQQEILQEIQE